MMTPRESVDTSNDAPRTVQSTRCCIGSCAYTWPGHKDRAREIEDARRPRPGDYTGGGPVAWDPTPEPPA